MTCTANNTTETTDKSRVFIIRRLQNAANNYTEKIKGYKEKYFKEAIETGRNFGESVKKDVKKVFDDAVEGGKERINRIHVVETVKNKISSGLKRIREKANIPGKEDIEKLTSAIEALHAKMEKMKDKE